MDCKSSPSTSTVDIAFDKITIPLTVQHYHSSSTEVSLQKCINRLADICHGRTGFHIRYGTNATKTRSFQRKNLKKKLYDVLLHCRSSFSCEEHSIEWNLVSKFLPNSTLSFYALQFHLKLAQKHYSNQDRLEKLAKQVLEGGDSSHVAAMSVLMLLAKFEASVQSENGIDFTVDFCQLPRKGNRFMTVKSLEKELNKCCTDDTSNEDHVDKNEYDVDSGFSILPTKSSSLDASFSLPSLLPTQDLNLTQFVQSRQVRSSLTDEGCFTNSSSLNTSCDSSCFSSDYLLDDDEPYLGYRKPTYDVKVWEESVKTTRHHFCTWETANDRTNKTRVACVYLTEAGNAVYDAIWQSRVKLVHEMASALHKSSGKQLVVPVRPISYTVDEATLLFHVRLVSCGIASETFHFNTIANMFLPRKNVIFSGVTSSSLRMVLMTFAKWGTAYWRLLRFSAFTLSSVNHFDGTQDQFKSVIFKAFCEGIRMYLYEYQRFLLDNETDINSLLQRLFKFRRLGLQICYLCQFCCCGDPSNAFKLNWDNFPTGVNILSYVYEKALFCTDSADRLVLLYLLRKCCTPYLKFIQNWVFHGMCWDLTGDFMITIIADNGRRRDRRRWSEYVVPIDAEDRKSSVPSFLLPISQSLFVCGKTIELLHCINPDYFLCTYSLDVPQLIVTYSQSRMEGNSRLWNLFQRDMRDLELSSTVSWLENEEKKKREKQAIAAAAREEHDRDVKAQLESSRNVLIQTQQTKQAELMRLKQQAEDAAKRKEAQKAKKNIVEKLENEGKNQASAEEKLLNKAKDELISHYEKLYDEVDKRKRKADWKLKRFALEDKRRKFFESEKVYFADKDNFDVTKIPEAYRALRSDESRSENAQDTITPNTDNSSTSSTADHGVFKPGRNISDLGSEINPMRRKAVDKQHVSQESSLVDEHVLRKKQVDGQHVSQESSSATGSNLLEPVRKKAVGGQHVSLESSPLTGSNLFEPVRKKQVQGHHVSQESSPTVENMNLRPGIPTMSRKQVGGQHVSQSTISFSSVFVDDNPKREVKVHPGLEETTEETPKNLRKLVGDNHVSQSSMQSIFSEPQPIKDDKASMKVTAASPLLKKDEPRVKESRRHVSKSSVQKLMYYENTSTPLRISDPVDNIPSSNVEISDDVIRIDGDFKEDSSKEITDRGENCNENPTYYKLPETGTYDVFIEMMLDRFGSAKKKKALDLDRMNLLSFYQPYDNEVIDEDILGLSEGDTSLIDMHSLPNLLENCILQPIKWHADLVNRCVVNYFMMDLNLPHHFKTLRRFLLLEDGEFGSALSRKLFNLVHSGRTPTEVLNPLNLDSILDHSLHASRESLSSHGNLSIAVKYLPIAFSTSNLQALDCLELCYYVGWPCNVVITRESHAKYNKVLSFLLQLNYVSWALHEIRIRLNLLSSRSRSTNLKLHDIQKLQIYRHEMHNFVKVMQGYVSTQVLHVCWQEFWDDLRKNVSNLDDLHDRHSAYLSKCIKRCLLTKKAQNVMNVICDVLKAILRFQSQLSVAAPLSLLNKTYQEFTRLSNFLYKVVSKLVQRGYQPHLEDFLTRLNFNDFYKT